MKTSIFCFVGLLLTFNLLAGELPTPPPGGKLTGRVVDARGEALPGVTVALKGTVRGTVTNAAGRYRLEALAAGTYTLRLSAVGMAAEERSLRVEAGSTQTVDFQMNESGKTLAVVTIAARASARGYLEETEGFSINAAKKNELIQPAKLDANLAMNSQRQVFGRTPGLMIWENDGSGVQINVAARGLSPNRSWEFNVRQNGYDVSSDPLGYPEAYYNPPLEAVERIELVRGAAALQNGPQFGGLLNYVLKGPDPNRPFSLETQLNTGSNGLGSVFVGMGGTRGRVSYYGYVHHRRGDGWRQDNAFEVSNAFGQLSWAVTPKLRVGLELTAMNYVNQQPGGLTDAQFAQNARQSTRSRNWFSTPWLVPAVTAEYVVSDRTKLSLKSFGLIGERNSIGFTAPITTPDAPNAQGVFANRQIDRDRYENAGTELRLRHDYQLRGRKGTLLTGLRYYSGNTRRQQQGRGNTGTDFNLDLQTDRFPRDLDFNNQNVAAFAENLLKLNERWSVTAGLRLEHLTLRGEGRMGIRNGQDDLLPTQRRNRTFLLGGLGVEYHTGTTGEVYANVSQAYRPVMFADLTPPATIDQIDPNLRDASGFSADLGYRSSWKNWLRYDINAFYLHYNNRIGTLTQSNAEGVRYQFRTNLGLSVSQGVEAFVEADVLRALRPDGKAGSLSAFGSLAFVDATYRDFRTASVVNGQIVEGNLAGKRVENAPRTIHRMGATYGYKGFSVTWQLNAVGAAFADASNTTTPNAAATTGLIPTYRVQDVAATYRFAKRFNVRGGINNLTDARYFTRRAGGYPGPGILPGDGRVWFLGVGVKL